MRSAVLLRADIIKVRSISSFNFQLQLSGASSSSDIVSPQRAEVADVKPAVRDHRVCPGLFSLVISFRLIRRR